MLGTTPQTVSNWVADGLLAGHVVGRALMVDKKTVESHFDTLKDIAVMEETVAARKETLSRETERLQAEMDDVLEGRELLGSKARSCLLRPVMGAIIDVAGKDVLTDRENAILSRTVDGEDMDSLVRSFGLTKARLLQIYHKSLTKVACMQDYSQMRREKKQLEKDKKALTAGLESLQNRVRELETMLELRLEKGREERQNGIYDESPGSMTNLLKTELSGMNLSVRCMVVLRREDIRTLGDLVRLRKTDVLKYRNIGRKSLTELDDMLEGLGLSWGMDVEKMIEADMLAMIRRNRKEEGNGECPQ